MKKFLQKRFDLKAGCGYAFLITALIISFSAINPVAIMAETQVILKGTLQGASCVHYKKKCPEDDVHIAIENDFVLVLPLGNHFFLPNLNRAIKARYVAKPVKITGKAEGNEIWVESLAVKKGKKYKTVWTLKEQEEMYKGGGG